MPDENFISNRFEGEKVVSFLAKPENQRGGHKIIAKTFALTGLFGPQYCDE